MAAARVAAGEVMVGALVPMLVPVVGLVQVAAVLLLLLLKVGAALLLAVGAALLLLLLLLLVAVGAASAVGGGGQLCCCFCWWRRGQRCCYCWRRTVGVSSGVQREEELEDVLRPPTLQKISVFHLNQHDREYRNKVQGFSFNLFRL